MQVLWSEELTYRALDQWTRELPIVAERGKITDRNGVVLADNRSAYTVYARSNAVKDKEKTASALANALDLEGQTLYDKLTKKKASEITVAKKIEKIHHQTPQEFCQSVWDEEESLTMGGI